MTKRRHCFEQLLFVERMSHKAAARQSRTSPPKNQNQKQETGGRTEGQPQAERPLSSDGFAGGTPTPRRPGWRRLGDQLR
jgi:hypothetical protein